MTQTQISIPKIQVQEIIDMLGVLAFVAFNETTKTQAHILSNALKNRVSDAEKKTR